MQSKLNIVHYGFAQVICYFTSESAMISIYFLPGSMKLFERDWNNLSQRLSIALGSDKHQSAIAHQKRSGNGPAHTIPLPQIPSAPQVQPPPIQWPSDLPTHLESTIARSSSTRLGPRATDYDHSTHSSIDRGPREETIATTNEKARRLTNKSRQPPQQTGQEKSSQPNDITRISNPGGNANMESAVEANQISIWPKAQPAASPTKGRITALNSDNDN